MYVYGSYAYWTKFKKDCIQKIKTMPTIVASQWNLKRIQRFLATEKLTIEIYTFTFN